MKQLKKKKISKRQLDILEFIKKNPFVQNREIGEYVAKIFGNVSRITLIRDLNGLLKQGLIKKEGKGRGAGYREAVENPLMIYTDPENYFKKETDERKAAFTKFNPNILDHFSDIFTSEELNELQKLNSFYQKKTKDLSPTALKKEYERLMIELSWKSSKLEGNTYTLIDTEILIKEKKEAKGHKREEAIMILNHKSTLDYIFSNKNQFKKINLRDIENIHRLLMENMGVSYGLRKRMVGIAGTNYKPLDNQYQIKEAIEETAKIINKLKDPFSKSLASILLISYIQPFEDGNKRTARLLGNALLLAFSVCPLSYRSINEADYKKAIILFYEQHSARFFKQLFVDQFKFSVENYF